MATTRYSFDVPLAVAPLTAARVEVSVSFERPSVQVQVQRGRSLPVTGELLPVESEVLDLDTPALRTARADLLAAVVNRLRALGVLPPGREETT